jgi:GDP-D-mannose dehydratase
VEIDPNMIRPAEVDFLCGDATKISVAIAERLQSGNKLLLYGNIDLDGSAR